MSQTPFPLPVVVPCPKCGAKIVTVNAAVAEWIQIPDAHCQCGFNGVIEWTNPDLEVQAAAV